VHHELKEPPLDYRRSFLVGAGVALLTAFASARGPLADQNPTPTGSQRAHAWTLTRTPWGHPDLQGIWNSQTATPLERPAEFAGRDLLSPTEIAALNARAAESRDSRAPRPGDPGTYNQFWSDDGVTVVESARTSLIVEPPDGRIPWQPGALERLRDQRGDVFESYADLDTGERCVTDGPTLVPSQSYNMNFEFLQTPQYVAILHEMYSNRHIVPLDGRPRLTPSIGQWLGDSRGRWEGDTLVVETSGFADQLHHRWARPWRASRPTLHVVERFRRLDADTLQYRVTITDPTMFTAPWTVEIPMKKTEGRLFEYACHEGNQSIANVLSGARARDRAAGEAESRRP
jgi:hypothetical protein